MSHKSSLSPQQRQDRNVDLARAYWAKKLAKAAQADARAQAEADRAKAAILSLADSLYHRHLEQSPTSGLNDASLALIKVANDLERAMRWLSPAPTPQEDAPED